MAKEILKFDNPIDFGLKPLPYGWDLECIYQSWNRVSYCEPMNKWGTPLVYKVVAIKPGYDFNLAAYGDTPGEAIDNLCETIIRCEGR